MRRALFGCVLAGLLSGTLFLTGCGSATPEEGAGSSGNDTIVRIADERILGQWTGDDGVVEFRADGTLVLDDGSEVPFAMPDSDRVDVEFAAGTRTFNITWDGDDRHGVLATDSTTTTPTWYVRR